MNLFASSQLQTTRMNLHLMVVVLLVVAPSFCDAFSVHSHNKYRPSTTFRRFLSSKTTASSSADASSSSSSTSSSKSLTLFSPSKINLFLRIIRKRDDGFHDLASLFQAVGFGDTLELSVLDDDDANNADVFSCNMVGVPTDSSNLVLRALELMRTKTNHRQTYFAANLIKSVPAQAGLGGGSANAATAMFGANELMGRPATMEQMLEWSGELGSDITFFLSRGTAYCTGRGEIMTPVDPPLASGTKLCIVKPDIGLSTPAVFKALDYDLLSPQDPETLLNDFVTKGVNGVDDASYINDLEPPAFTCVPELRALKEELQQVPGLHHVMMSGSGTSIFCIGEPENRRFFEEEFGKRDGINVYFTEFINRKEGAWFERPSS